MGPRGPAPPGRVLARPAPAFLNESTRHMNTLRLADMEGRASPPPPAVPGDPLFGPVVMTGSPVPRRPSACGDFLERRVRGGRRRLRCTKRTPGRRFRAFALEFFGAPAALPVSVASHADSGTRATVGAFPCGSDCAVVPPPCHLSSVCLHPASFTASQPALCADRPLQLVPLPGKRHSKLLVGSPLACDLLYLFVH